MTCLGGYIKKLLKYKIIFFIGLAFSGCSSLTVTNSIPEVESPVYQGRKSFGFSFMVGPAKELTLIDDPSARPPDLTLKNLDISGKILARPAIHFYPLPLLSIACGIQNSSFIFLKAKINLLNGLMDDPPAGTIYAALNLESTYEQSKKSGVQKGLGGPTGYPWETKIENLTGTGGFSIGYQTRKKIVPFIGFNYQNIQTSGKIVQSPGVSDPGGTYDIQTRIGLTRVYAIGIDWKPKYGFFITPQINYFEFNWGGNEKKELSGSIKIIYIPVQ